MAEPLIVGTILAIITKKVFETLSSTFTTALSAKLNNGPTQKAFRESLHRAINEYAIGGTRVQLVVPLLKSSGPLASLDVATELGKILLFSGPPNAAVVGKRWMDAVDSWPDGYDAEKEATVLLGCLERQLRANETFRPVFDSHSLAAIETATTRSSTALPEIQTPLLEMLRLMASHQIWNYSGFIDEKTRGFVGRAWVFDAVDQFVASNSCGYFLVQGDPGIGKSSFAAQFVKARAAIHHFNIRAEGINRPEAFLANICWQLIHLYGLDYPALPAEATQDAGFLKHLLGEVSDRLNGRKVVVVVDALDEVDTVAPGVNPLFLPKSLPEGVFLIITTRKESLDKRRPIPRLSVEGPLHTLYLEQDSSGNVADVGLYLTGRLSSPGIQSYISAQGIDGSTFVKLLEEKSEHNFMYLNYVLPEIEHGYYSGVQLEALPQGLIRYYDAQWERMKGQDHEAWFKYKLPVVMALTTIGKPVSLEFLKQISGIHQTARVRSVLEDWAPFLRTRESSGSGEPRCQYWVYHASFHDFIASKEEVADERVDSKGALDQIIASLWAEYRGGRSPELEDS